MAVALFTVGDTAADLTGTCTNGTAPANLTGATLELHLKRADKTVLTKAATVVSGVDGTWKYTWAAGDLNSAGTWAYEVQVTYSNGKIQTFGSTGSSNSTFTVRQQIA